MPSESLMSANPPKTPFEKNSLRLYEPELEINDDVGIPSYKDQGDPQAVPNHPPGLGYDWGARRRSFVLTISGLLFFNVILPNVIFYVLLYHGDTDEIARGDNSILYGATTATLGTLQIPQWFWRWWECHKKNQTFVTTRHEPGEGIWRKVARGAKRSIECWDVFQWAFLGGILTGATTLLLGTCLNDDYGFWPLMALSPPIIFAFIGLCIGVLNVGHALGWRSPLPVPGRGTRSLILPGLVYTWTDLTAVDGGGRQAFRDTFERRWEASPPFRRMVTVLSWGISLPLILILGPEIALVVVIKNKGTDFVTILAHTWAPVWALLLSVLLSQTVWSYFYVRASFRREHTWWAETYGESGR